MCSNCTELQQNPMLSFVKINNRRSIRLFLLSKQVLKADHVAKAIPKDFLWWDLDVTNDFHVEIRQHNSKASQKQSIKKKNLK